MIFSWLSWADLKDLAVSPLIVLPLGAVVAWVSARWQRRADRRDELLNEAIAAVCRLQAARHGPSGIERLHFVPKEDRAEIAAKLREQMVRDFVEAARDARFALAAADPHVGGGLCKYWDKFEVSEAERDEVVMILLRARQRRWTRQREPRVEETR